MSIIKNRFLYSIFLLVAISFANCRESGKAASVILFNGTGTSPNDVEAIKNILSANQLDFVLVNSAQLNELDTGQLKDYKLIIVPGGDFIEMGKTLKNETTLKIHNAVYHGLNYLGICAGGFLAGNTQNNSFNITDDSHFKFYAIENMGIRKTVVPISNADGTVIEHYWEDGPQFTGWGKIVSKYPDGTPATVQANFGSGMVVLTGFHPEAPESWRKEFHFSSRIKESHDYARMLIMAALNKEVLSHFN